MSATKNKISADQLLVKALSHPLRQRILVELNRGTASPIQLATRLDERIGNVSYHVKILREHGAIELVETAQRRGAIEHFYRAISRPEISDEHWSQLPLSIRRALFDDTLQDIWEHAVSAAEQGGFDDDQTHVSWTPLQLDEAGYQEVVELLGRTLERVIEIQSEALAREGADQTQAPHRTEVAILHFHRA